MDRALGYEPRVPCQPFRCDHLLTGRKPASQAGNAGSAPAGRAIQWGTCRVSESFYYTPVAQWNRAVRYERIGRGFESCREYQFRCRIKPPKRDERIHASTIRQTVNVIFNKRWYAVLDAQRKYGNGSSNSKRKNLVRDARKTTRHVWIFIIVNSQARR